MLVRNNRYIPEEDRDFFILLRAGLWQKAEEPLSDSPDWEYIYTIACEQTVQGIVADGITIVKAAYDQGQFTTPFPTGEHWQETYDKFLSAVAQIVRRNHQINKKQSEINSIFDEQSIRYYVVKGQEAAKNYPKPMLRCPGDIDYLMPMQYFQFAKDVLIPKANRVEDENSYLVHVGMFFENVEVELHGSVHPNLGECIDKVLDQLQVDVFAGIVSIETFNTVYMMLHCLQHFHYSGLGIRQILDWMVLLVSCSKNIDMSRVYDCITSMNLHKEWDVFSTFSTEWCGLNPKYTFHCIGLSKHSFKLWKACRETGNMGHNKEFLDISGNFFSRNLNRIEGDISKYRRTHSISPSISYLIFKKSLTNYLPKTIKHRIF